MKRTIFYGDGSPSIAPTKPETEPETEPITTPTEEPGEDDTPFKVPEPAVNPKPKA